MAVDGRVSSGDAFVVEGVPEGSDVVVTYAGMPVDHRAIVQPRPEE